MDIHDWPVRELIWPKFTSNHEHNRVILTVNNVLLLFVSSQNLLSFPLLFAVIHCWCLIVAHQFVIPLTLLIFYSHIYVYVCNQWEYRLDTTEFLAPRLFNKFSPLFESIHSDLASDLAKRCLGKNEKSSPIIYENSTNLMFVCINYFILFSASAVCLLGSRHNKK